VNELNSFFNVYGAGLWLALLVIVIGLGGWLALLQRRLRNLERRYTALMTGATGTDLEAVLNEHLERVRGTVGRVEALEEKTNQLEKTLRHSMQWLGVVRFNPFPDMGGDLSFAIALVDGVGNGVVISSLHSRQGTRVYAKPLHRWESSHPLTDEEKEAIARAYRQRG